MSDDTAAARSEMLALMPAELRKRIDRGEEVLDTKAMTEQYEVLTYMAPFVIVIRRSDGVRGSLMFTHVPRWYFGWEPADANVKEKH